MADPIVLKWEEEGLSSLLRAIAELNRSLKKNEEQVEKTDKETRKHEKTQGALTRQARGTAKAMRAFGDAASGVNAQAGRFTRTGGRMLGIFANFAAVGGGAGVAVAGLATALVGTVGAAGAATVAIIKTAASGRALAKELAPLRNSGILPAIDSATLKSFDTIRGSGLALQNIVKGLSLSMASDLAPQIEYAAVTLVKFGLLAVDAFNDFSTGGGLAYNAARKIAIFFGSSLLQAIGAPVSALTKLLSLYGSLVRTMAFSAQVAANAARAAGAEGLAGAIETAASAANTAADGLQYLDEKWDGLTDTLAGRVVDGLGLVDVVFGTVASTIAQATEGLDKYDAKARQIIQTSLRMAAAKGEENKAQEQLLATILRLQSDALDGQDKILFAYDQEIAKINALEKAGGAAADAQEARDLAALKLKADLLAIHQQLATAEDEAAERRRADAASFAADVAQGHKDRVGAAVESASMVTSSFASITSDLSSIVGEEAGRAALAMFRANQAAGIANATVSTFVAATKALELGPIAGPIAAGAIGAAGAANVAAIAAQPPPQVERHMGSPMRGARDPLAPDEMSMGGVRGLRQEGYTPGGVLSSQGVNALNAQRVSDSAQGQAPGAVWKHLGRELPRRIDGGESRTSASVRRAARREQSPSGRRGW